MQWWIIFYHVLQAVILKTSAYCVFPAWQTCAEARLSEHTVGGTNILNISCVGETSERNADIYWTIQNTNPPYLINARRGCIRTRINFADKTTECDLELDIGLYRGCTFYCHIGSFYKQMYTLPQTDVNQWTSIYIEGLSGAEIEYRTSASVEATCVIDVSKKIYPKDFTVTWMLLNGNSLTLDSTFDPNKRQMRAHLKHKFQSSDDRLRIACICRHHLYGECGRREVWLKLKEDTTLEIGPATTTQPESIPKKPESSRMWLAFGLSAASLVLLSALSIFIWRYFLMNKVNEDLTEELCNDVTQMYAVPIKKSQRNKEFLPSSEQDLAAYDAPNDDEYIYANPELENDCNIYVNVPIPTSSNSTVGRPQDLADIEPVYANTVFRYKPNM